MSEPTAVRLSSVHLEDLAIVALTGRPGSRIDLYPSLSDDRRSRLRGRLKQVGRSDWPANLREDPLLRRGYTLRQCCRLLTALLLLDAHLPPAFAIPLARAHEPLFLKAMLPRLAIRSENLGSDLIVLIALGELHEVVSALEATTSERIRLIERDNLSKLWSPEFDGAVGRQRLVIDAGAAASVTWNWLRGRDLMPFDEPERLVAEFERESA